MSTVKEALRLRRIRVGESAAGDSTGAIPGTRRRDFLRPSALLASSALGNPSDGRSRQRCRAQIREPAAKHTHWMEVQGEPVVSAPYGVPSRYEADVIRRATNITTTLWSSWSFTPLQDLHGIITPMGWCSSAITPELQIRTARANDNAHP